MRLELAPTFSVPTTPVHAQSAVHLVAPALQAIGHQIGCCVLFVGEFGVFVDAAADGDHLRFVSADLLERGQLQWGIHGVGLRQGWRRTHSALRPWHQYFRTLTTSPRRHER